MLCDRQPTINQIDSKKHAKLFCTILEVANATGLSAYYIRQGVREGWIPHIKCGNKIMINMHLFLMKLNEISQKGTDADE